MKSKNLIPLLLIVFSINCFSQTINIPDIEFKKILVSNKKINTNNDKEISQLEAKSYKDSVLVSSLNIESLLGIEYFINIHYLDCSYNSLTSLDLTKNIELKSLYCIGNQLTELNLNFNNKLEEVSCESNELTHLDLSSQNNLTYLNCDKNQLTNLDLRNKKELTNVSCEFNNLTILNLLGSIKLENLRTTFNENLKCIMIEDAIEKGDFSKEAFTKYSKTCPY